MYVADLAYQVWEIIRLRRCKDSMINSQLCASLAKLLARLLTEPGVDLIETENKAHELARAWFTDAEAKARIRKLLNEFELDESAIEAEAVRALAPDLELLDRMLASLESRRNKALRSISEYRDTLARRLREATNRIAYDKPLLIESDSTGEHNGN